jgi:hypothetical protein
MKKTATIFAIAASMFCCNLNVKAQGNLTPYSFNHTLTKDVSSVLMPEKDFTQEIADAEAFEKAGNYPRFAYHFSTNLSLVNSGTWTNLPNGDRLWQLQVKSSNALSTALFFENFWLPEGSMLSVYSPDRKQVYNYTHENNQGNNLFSTEFIRGEEQIVEYFEPASAKNQGSMKIHSVSHQYRSIEADPCEVNIICTPEGDNWQDEKKGVCRVYVVEGSSAGYCSGTLINNTALDCKRYILTAFHCGVNSTTANFNSWVFRFNFEATMCTGQADTFGANNAFTGCTKKADSGDGGGTTGSDFLLLEMTATTSPTWWSGVYWNGWTRATAAPTGGGVGIHHPAGSNKKISTFSATPTSSTWGGSTPNTHWMFAWAGTTNGHGVTEGGSSGSPIFNSVGLVFGTLTGGASYCTALTAPDRYGKLSYHWASNGTTANRQLQPWLDPGSTGVTTLNGAYSPCTTTGINTIDANKDVIIYPNPSSGLVNIYIKDQNGNDVKVKVVNITGQQLTAVNFTKNPTGMYAIDLSEFAKGIYFVEVKSGENTIVEKIVVK